MKWQVSIQMIVRRARDIGAISHRSYRQMFQQIGAKGWRVHEPVAISVERPRLYRKAAEVFYMGEDCERRLAEDYGIGEALSRSLLSEYSHR